MSESGWRRLTRASVFALRRALISLATVLVALMLASFLLVHLVPGDPAVRVAGLDATPQDIANIRHALGLDRPLVVQFARYVGNVARLDFGKSFVTNEPVVRVIADRLPKTLELAAAAMLAVMMLSVPLGMTVAAITRNDRNRGFELVFTAITATMSALPNFLSATFLAFAFAVWLRWLPAGGGERWDAVILPAAAIGLRPMADLARIVRVETLGALAQDYALTARGKRLPWRLIYLRHILPNVLTGALTIGGLLFAGLIGGTVVVENVFAWPGLGTALVQAILARDYPVVQGITLLLGLAVITVNTTVDTVLVLVDPRSLPR
jgi:peptide/nickel transport system permease protein